MGALFFRRSEAAMLREARYWRCPVIYRRPSDHLDWIAAQVAELACGVVAARIERRSIRIAAVELGNQVAICALRVAEIESEAGGGPAWVSDRMVTLATELQDIGVGAMRWTVRRVTVRAALRALGHEIGLCVDRIVEAELRRATCDVQANGDMRRNGAVLEMVGVDAP